MVRQTCRVSGTVHARCIGIHHTTHKHTEEWSHIPLARDPQSLFPGDQGSRCKYPISRLINPASSEPIWLICDASLYGVGTLYGQGEDWKTCHPAGFMSKKLTNAQHNYCTFEQETLAILEALLKWEDKLLGFPFKIITDHEALTYLSTQQKLSSQQIRWTDCLSRFNAEIVYMKGVDNKVADCLSRYYETEGGEGAHECVDWVNADIRLNLEGDDLRQDQLRELRLASMRASQGKVQCST